jgi:micrococcal nuclease
MSSSAERVLSAASDEALSCRANSIPADSADFRSLTSPGPPENMPPLCPIALWNSPLAKDETMRAFTLNDPADCPAILFPGQYPSRAGCVLLTIFACFVPLRIKQMPMKLLRLLILAILILFPVTAKAQDGESTAGIITLYNVIRVVDGDTFWVDDGSEKGLKIRLTGIDAPEPRNSGRKSIGYFGSESSDYLKQMLTGKKVRLEYDVARYDRYGRTLAYAFLEDGTFINAEMVKSGYATVMTIPPNVRHAHTFTRLSSEARRERKGLWNTGGD